MSVFRTLGLNTELLAMRGAVDVAEHPDRIVVRTPSEPDYWFGNYIAIRDDTVAPQDQVAQFQRDFPEARHIVIRWDIADLPEGPGLAALREMGLEIEHCDVLTRVAAPGAVAVPAGFEIRAIDTESDWAQVEALHIAIGHEEGYGEGHDAHVRERFRTTRRQIAEGLGARFGAFDGAQLAADLGVIHDDHVIRYQSVATDARYRRRGLCAALVAHAGRWAKGRAPGATLVIHADPDGDAGRIYRRAGFAGTERITAAVKPGY